MIIMGTGSGKSYASYLCDRCDRPAVAFYSISVAIDGIDGDGEMEDEARCQEHRRDRTSPRNPRGP